MDRPFATRRGFLNRFNSPALRALRTQKTTRLEKDLETNAMTEFGTALDLYFGDMEASIALSRARYAGVSTRWSGG